jgi:hypothetical protein
MVRIPVSFERPVETTLGTPWIVDVKYYSAAVGAGAVTRIPGFNKPGSTYRLLGINFAGTNGDAVGRWAGLVLLQGPGGAGTNTYYEDRIAIPAGNNVNISWLPGGPGIQTSTFALAGADYWQMTLPDYRFDSSLTPAITTGALVTGNYSIIYEEYLV